MCLFIDLIFNNYVVVYGNDDLMMILMMMMIMMIMSFVISDILDLINIYFFLKI